MSFTPSGLKMMGRSQPRALTRGDEWSGSFGAETPIQCIDEIQVLFADDLDPEDCNFLKHSVIESSGE